MAQEDMGAMFPNLSGQFLYKVLLLGSKITLLEQSHFYFLHYACFRAKKIPGAYSKFISVSTKVGNHSPISPWVIFDAKS